MLEPQELYQVEPDVPDLRGAVLLYEFRGFMDAGQAASGLAEYLLEEYEHEVVARFDTDQLVDYRGRRPGMTFSVDHWEEYEAPELVAYAVRDDTGVPFVLLSGIEPDHQWERFTAAVRSLMDLWGIRLAVGFHGIPMGAPHTRPLGVTAHATRQALLPNHERVLNRLKVPGNVGALLELRLGEAGHDAVGFAAHVPHYLSQSAYPRASVRLLESIRDVTGLSLSDEPLRESGREVDAEVDAQVRASDEVAEVVRALERQYDMFVEGNSRDSLLAGDDELPTGDEIGAELERFLAENHGPTPES
ncbi:MAG TPA: PAC2 family protein [Stackebrandtia sp.]|jgi:hypothetical protein|nr:PAC2 family protein [Stackebrandtia sp.]HZE39806.1 PAC2 family protein [Stackebrandtia sp.]